MLLVVASTLAAGDICIGWMLPKSVLTRKIAYRNMRKMKVLGRRKKSSVARPYA